MFWNIAGVLENPKGIMVYSYNPYYVLNAISFISGFDPDQVVAIFEVDLGEYICTSDPVL
jgi:hypothetical protein